MNFQPPDGWIGRIGMSTAAQYAGSVPYSGAFLPDRVMAYSGRRSSHRMATAEPHTMTAEDARRSALMAAAQAGDKIAYQTLLRDCVPLIRAIARRLGVNPGQVDDVVQEVLLTIHRARQTYDPVRSFTAWLRIIAERRAIDLLRQSGRSLRSSLQRRGGRGGAQMARRASNARCAMRGGAPCVR